MSRYVNKNASISISDSECWSKHELCLSPSISPRPEEPYTSSWALVTVNSSWITSGWCSSHDAVYLTLTYYCSNWELFQSCYFLIKDYWKDVIFKQVSKLLSQNDLLYPNQPSFKSSHSTEMTLLSVTVTLRAAWAAAQSSVLILLDLSTASDTVKHAAIHTLWYGHLGQSLFLDWIISHWGFFQCAMARTCIHISLPPHRGAPGFSASIPNLYNILYLFGSDFTV